MAIEQSEIDRLTPPERLALISQLWDSLDSEHVPLTAVQREELDRRFETLEEDCENGISWEDLNAEMERRCP